MVALVATVALVYLELPLRAGPFRAPLVYGHPETWEGFWYVVLAEQFRGSLQDPFGDIGGKVAALVRLTVAEFGILAPVVPIAFIVTAMRRPRYALLTGTSVLITCFFASSYVNADISRYYLGPVLMAWTWLAILGGLLVDAVGVDTGDSLRRRPTLRSAVALLVAIALVAPSLLAARSTYCVDRRQRRPQGRRLDGPGARPAGARRDGRQLVELLDAALVRPDRRGPAA